MWGVTSDDAESLSKIVIKGHEIGYLFTSSHYVSCFGEISSLLLGGQGETVTLFFISEIECI